MKINYLLLILLGFSSHSFSQITITSTDMPVVNDTLRMSRALLDASIDFQSTGPNFNWNFSSLQNNNQKLNTYSPVSSSGSTTQFVFGTMAASRYKASYFIPNEDLPLNNLPAFLPITFSDINQFLKVNTDALTMVGLSMNVNGQTIPAKPDTIETKYVFPLNYGDSYTSRGYINLDLNPIYDANWRQRRKRTTQVDGWGEITTPYGTFSALRIHHRIVESDSIRVSVGGFNNWVGIPIPVAHEYEWRAVGEKEPILVIKTNEISGGENVTAIEYRNEIILSVQESSLNFNIYPNPATNHLTIESKSGLSAYEIITTDGRVVQSGVLNDTLNWMNIEALESGTYLLRASSESKSAIQRFVKQ